MGAADAPPSTLKLRLAYRPPLDFDALLRFLGDRAVPGVEEVRDGAYRRVLVLVHGTAIVSLRHGGGVPSARGDAERGAAGRGDADARDSGPHVVCEVALADGRDRAAVARACRALLDLDADPDAIAATLGDDPLLGPLVRANPGRRMPGHVDPHELAVRAVLGQQVSIAAAATLAGRLAAAHGEPVSDPGAGLTHAFPTAAALAEVDPGTLAMPRSRANALLALAQALASGELVLTPETDPERADAELRALPGIGPWTASYVRMRALGDRDVFLPTDLGVRHALERLGEPGDPPAAAALADRWRPWRSYALTYLWGRLAADPPAAGAPGSG